MVNEKYLRFWRRGEISMLEWEVWLILPSDLIVGLYLTEPVEISATQVN
jgi:hypothetical protein